MQIECILKREGGTHVNIGDEKYHFRPNAAGAHVAEVTNKEHIKRFLSISDAYEYYDPDSAGPNLKSISSADTLLGSSVHPSSFEIEGTSYTLGEVVALAHADSGLSAEEWNALPEEKRHELIDEALDKLADDKGGDTGDQADDRASLIEQYKEKFGRTPNGRMSTENMRKALEG